ncbi:MAG: DUF167 domain-containing protein [Nanoarchaeota archaeon]|nr:DUF167 domain-containing protein [Nanoarchaeota archaeon]
MKINIKVKPNSATQEIEKKGDYYLVKLKSSPVDGKANLELIKILSKYFKKEARIKSGFTSRKKIVEMVD